MIVFVENLELLGRHGVYPEERAEGRLYQFDLEVELAAWETGDELTGTLDYRQLVAIVDGVVGGESVRLIETLAWRIVCAVFEQHAAATRVGLRIRKRATGIEPSPQWVGASFDVLRTQWERHARRD